MKTIMLILALASTTALADFSTNLRTSIGQTSGNLDARGDSHSFGLELDYWNQLVDIPVAVSLSVSETMGSLKTAEPAFKTLIRTQNLDYGLGLKFKTLIDNSITLVSGVTYAIGDLDFSMNRSSITASQLTDFRGESSAIILRSVLEYQFSEKFQLQAGVVAKRTRVSAPASLNLNSSSDEGTGLSLNEEQVDRSSLNIPATLSFRQFALELGLAISL